MKIVILSDVHDNTANLEKCLDWCKKNKVEKIFCCGDLTNGQTLKKLSSFSATVYLVRGNAEIYEKEEVELYDNVVYFGEIGTLKIGEILIGLCHEPFRFNKLLQKKVDIIFYGHTHKPWIEEKGNVKFVNPGTLNGMSSRSTFTFWDVTNHIMELKSVDD